MIFAFVSDPVPSVGVAALLAGMAGAPRVGGQGGGIGLDTRELPLAAIAFVDANGLRDRMYNDFEIGSYLLFEPAGGYPRHRVFVDPRLPAYPAEFHRLLGVFQCLHRLLGRSDLTRAEWSAAMDGFGVQTALLAYAGINPRVSWWDPERYALVFREADARVFVRRLPRFAPEADRDGTFFFLRLLVGGRSAGSARRSPPTPPPARESRRGSIRVRVFLRPRPNIADPARGVSLRKELRAKRAPPSRGA